MNPLAAGGGFDRLMADAIPQAFARSIIRSLHYFVPRLGTTDTGVPLVLFALAFLAGVWLLQRRDLGFVFAPVVLSALIALAIGIVVLAIVANQRDGDATGGVIAFVGLITLLQAAALWRLLTQVKSPVVLRRQPGE